MTTNYEKKASDQQGIIPTGEKTPLELATDAKSIAEGLISYEHADVRKLAFAVRHVARALQVALVENPEAGGSETTAGSHEEA